MKNQPAPSIQQRMDLSGEWQIALDPEDKGVSGGWATGRFPYHIARPVNVPGLWNLVYPEYEGIAFYRKTFTIPEAWGDQVTLFQSEGVCYKTDLWINGQYAGSHEGAYTGFGFDISAYLRVEGENELVMRVAGLSKNRPVDGIQLHQAPASKQAWYFTHGGPWGKNWLERRAPIYVSALVLEPDFRRELLHTEVTLTNARPQLQEITLAIEIAGPAGEQVASQLAPICALPGQTRHAFDIPIPRPLAWSCEIPNMYRVRVAVLSAGGQSDVVEERFGMRDFTLRDGQYILNGDPVFIRGILLQPHYPITQVTPQDAEVMRQEITLMKEAGFNLIRCHIRPAPPGYLDLTDELGMFVYAETSLAWIRESPRIREHGEREIRALIERDRNHPSVVIWGLLNENPPASAAYSEYFLRCARAIDPTRVVIDNSGGSLAFDQDFGWIDRCYALADRETARQKVLDIHAYLGNNISHDVYEWLRGLGARANQAALLDNDFCSMPVLEEFERECRRYRGKIFISELGGGGMADLEADYERYEEQVHLVDALEIAAFRNSMLEGFAERKLNRIFGSPKNMATAAQQLQASGDVRQLEAVLTNPRLSGYVLTQLNDLSYEFHAGILDTWRRPKPAYHAIRRINQAIVLVLKAASPVVACGEAVEVYIRLVSETAVPAGSEVVIEIRGPGQEGYTGQRWEVQPRGGIQEIAATELLMGSQPGQYHFSARCECAGQMLALSTETILALSRVELEESLACVEWLGLPAGLAGAEARAVRECSPDNPIDPEGKAILIAPNPAALSYRLWETLLAAVRDGRTAVIGPLTGNDERPLAALRSDQLEIELDYGIGSWSGCYHWIPDAPLFTELPCGGFAGEAYIDVLPSYCLAEQSGQVLAGAVRSKHVVGADSIFHWYSDIEAVPHGRGRLVFCQYRLFDRLGTHPLARRMFKNLVELWK